MEKNRFTIESEHQDAFLIERLTKHPKHSNPEEIERAKEVLLNRGYPDNLLEIFQNILLEQNDEALIAIVESEEETYHPLYVALAEKLLLDKGYQIETEDRSTVQNDPITTFKSKDGFDPQDVLKPRFYVIAETEYYLDAKCSKALGRLTAGALYAYKREILRHGRNLLLIRLKEQNKVYVKIDPSKIFICDQFVVTKNPIDIILLPFEQYHQFISNPTITSTQPSKKIEEKIQSNIRKEDSIVIATVKDLVLQANDKKTFVIHKAYFSEVAYGHIRLGRMFPQFLFYNIEPIQAGRVTKIMTDDGTEALLLSHPNTYIKLETPLEKSTGCLVTILSIILSLALIILVFQHTDYFIISTLFIIPIIFLVKLFIGIPFYFVFSQLNKRL